MKKKNRKEINKLLQEVNKIIKYFKNTSEFINDNVNIEEEKQKIEKAEINILIKKNWN